MGVTIKMVATNSQGTLSVIGNENGLVSDDLFRDYFWQGPIHSPRKPSNIILIRGLVEQLCRNYKIKNRYNNDVCGLFRLLYDVATEDGAVDEAQAWAWACKRGREFGIYPSKGTVAHMNKAVGDIKKYTR
jgi:hypothetical protein